jgi:hypothetical protein
MNWPQFDAGNWIAIGSAAIALLSLWNAFMARRTANRSYTLAVEARDAAKPSLDLYIDRGYIRRLTGPARRVFVFRIMVTNRSDAPNAIKSVRLLIEHRRGDGLMSHLEVDADGRCAPALEIAPDDLLGIPLPMSQRAVVAGFVFFPVAKALLADTRVEAYTVSVIDTFDKESVREVLLLNEYPHEQVGKETSQA